jgi:hypothetical protein
MPLPESDGGQRPRRRSSFQYSLRSMLILTTVAAVGLSLFTAAPTWLIYLVLMLFAVAAPMVLTVVVIYGRGYARTFCIGALFPVGVLLSNLSRGLAFVGMGGFPRRLDAEDRLFVMFFAFVACLVAAGFGLLAMWVRRIVEGRAGGPTQTAAPGGASAPDDSGPAATAQDPAEPGSPFG